LSTKSVLFLVNSGLPALLRATIDTFCRLSHQPGGELVVPGNIRLLSLPAILSVTTLLSLSDDWGEFAVLSSDQSSERSSASCRLKVGPSKAAKLSHETGPPQFPVPQPDEAARFLPPASATSGRGPGRRRMGSDSAGTRLSGGAVKRRVQFHQLRIYLRRQWLV
jgi:hypothetical protein